MKKRKNECNKLLFVASSATCENFLSDFIDQYSNVVDIINNGM